MTPEGWTAEAWQEQMHAEVKVAYRLVELGLVGDPDSIPYDPEEVARIDAEYDKWKDEVELAAAEKALNEAANELALLDDGGKRGLAGHSKSSASAITHRHAVAVVRARAEAYRQERGEQ